MTMVFVCISSICFAQPNADSLNETINRIQAKIEIGLNYSDYHREVQNLQFEMNKYDKEFDKYYKKAEERNELLSSEVQNTLSKLIGYKFIIENHKCALLTWELKLLKEDEWIAADIIGDFWDDMTKKNPEFEIKSNTKTIKGVKYIKADAMVLLFWIEINNKIKELGI